MYLCDYAVDHIYISTAVSCGRSSSDIEALHQAYYHLAHSGGDAGEEGLGSSARENAKSSAKDHPQEDRESPKHISTTESGKS